MAPMIQRTRQLLKNQKRQLIEVVQVLQCAPRRLRKIPYQQFLLEPRVKQMVERDEELQMGFLSVLLLVV